MFKKILFFLLIFNVAFSHTLKNYRTDVFVGKNRKILIVETSDILLENDVKHYMREIFADTRGYEIKDLKVEIDNIEIKNIEKIKNTGTSSIIVNLNKVKKGTHNIRISFWYKLNEIKNEGNSIFLVPIYNHYRNPEKITEFLKTENFSYSYKLENTQFTPEIKIQNFLGDNLMEATTDIPLMLNFVLNEKYFGKEKSNKTESKIETTKNKVEAKINSSKKQLKKIKDNHKIFSHILYVIGIIIMFLFIIIAVLIRKGSKRK